MTEGTFGSATFGRANDKHNEHDRLLRTMRGLIAMRPSRASEPAWEAAAAAILARMEETITPKQS